MSKKLALVFGGSRGIGAACVETLKADFEVSFTSTATVDIQKPEDVRRTFDDLEKRHGRKVDCVVVNAGINGDTTEGMLERLDRAVPNGTSAVILQPGGNDRRKGRPDRTADIQTRLGARGIPVTMLGNGMLRGLPHQPDGQHLTPEGYHMLAEQLASQVSGAIGR